jgi:hypothetical protein
LRYAVETLDCTNDDVITQAAVSAVLEQTTKSADANAYVIDKLRQYMGKAYDPAVSLAANIASFIKSENACNTFIVNNQSINLNIKGINCNNGSFYLLNQSNISVRCAAKGLTNLLPDKDPAPPSPAPASRPWYYISPSNMYLLISLGAVFIGLAVTLGVVRGKLSAIIAPLPSQ